MLPVLYSFRRCPYAMRARMAIAVSAQSCELREIVLRNKPAPMLEASPKGTVPVLVLPEGRVIDQSLDIMLWALAKHDPQAWLEPEEGSLDDALALIEQCELMFKPSLDRYKYPDRYTGADALQSREQCLAWLRELDQRLMRFREQTAEPSLFGRRPCLADAALMPFVRQFAQVDRAWSDRQSWAELPRWLDAWLASELFEAVMAKHPVWDASQAAIVFPGA